MSRRTVTTRDIEHAADDVTELKRTFLRERGWDYSSANPGHLWLWQKTITDGRVVLVNESTAMHLAEYDDQLALVMSGHEYGDDAYCRFCGAVWDDIERANYPKCPGPVRPPLPDDGKCTECITNKPLEHFTDQFGHYAECHDCSAQFKVLHDCPVCKQDNVEKTGERDGVPFFRCPDCGHEWQGSADGS